MPTLKTVFYWLCWAEAQPTFENGKRPSETPFKETP
jgi:hypothetical protein